MQGEYIQTRAVVRGSVSVHAAMAAAVRGRADIHVTTVTAVLARASVCTPKPMVGRVRVGVHIHELGQ